MKFINLINISQPSSTFLETQTEKAGGFHTESQTCCGEKFCWAKIFMSFSSGKIAVGTTGRSGTMQRQQQGPQTQQIGIGQADFSSSLSS